MDFASNRSFILTILCIVGAFTLAFLRPGTETAVLTTLPVILGAYIGAKATEKVMSVKEAAKDPECDTAEVIKHTIR
jgi:uncharacterized membrane protein YfcA